MKELNYDKAAYHELLISIKQQIRSAQAKAALTVNATVIQLYWNLGSMIAENQALAKGRSSFIDQLSKDLQAEFPDVTGFSKRNLFDIRRFFLFYRSVSVQQAAALNTFTGNNVGDSSVRQAAALKTEGLTSESAQQVDVLKQTLSNQQTSYVPELILQVPWGHHVLVLSKVKEVGAALFYLQQIAEHNWSRTILILQIEQNLFARLGKAINNFNATLPSKQSVMAQQILKDPYNFGFLTLEASVQELDIEKQLTAQITNFLLELGKGFAFIGRQYQLSLGEKTYRLDLLFYHIKLRCYVVIDLKTGAFEPEFAGKMNFYLNLTDDLLKSGDDHPIIGIILCKSKTGIEVEYALRGLQKPIGVSAFTVTDALPAELKSSIPTVAEFEEELNKNDLTNE